MGPVLRGINLSQFRSYRRAQLELTGQPIAIFGPNGSGKTNLLEAVSLLSPGRGLRRAVAGDMARKAGSGGWKIEAEVSGGALTHKIVTESQGGASRQVTLDDKRHSQQDLAGIIRLLWLIPAMDRLWIEAAEGRRRFLDRAAMSFDPLHAQASLSYEKAMRERNRLLKEGRMEPSWLGALEDQMAGSAVRIQQARHKTIEALARAQRDAATSFPAADLTLTHANGTLPADGDGLRQMWHDGRRRDEAAGRTISGPHRCDLQAIWRDKGIAARDCSTGEQKALLVSLILANARALPRPPVILLDEVSAHLDRERRGALYGEISALKAQVWMTGTERELYDGLPAGAQFYEVRETGEGSTLKAASS